MMKKYLLCLYALFICAIIPAAQPHTGFGFDKLFGVSQTYVEFTPDILTDMEFRFMGRGVCGGTFLQYYSCTTAVPCGYAECGAVIAARNRYGKGETLLIGTFPSEAYLRKGCAATRDFFTSLLPLFGRGQTVVCSNASVKARLQTGETGTYLWALNTSEEIQNDVDITVSYNANQYTLGSLCRPRPCRREAGTGDSGAGSVARQIGANSFRLSVPAQDAVIVRLEYLAK